MIPSISRMLFATDLLPSATYALRHAAGLAKATGAEIHILQDRRSIDNEKELATCRIH